VDFILDDGATAVEVKSSATISTQHLKGLRAWKQEHPESRCILISREQRARLTEDQIEILPWQVFLEELWAR